VQIRIIAGWPARDQNGRLDDVHADGSLHMEHRATRRMARAGQGQSATINVRGLLLTHVDGRREQCSGQNGPTAGCISPLFGNLSARFSIIVLLVSSWSFSSVHALSLECLL